MSIEAEQHRGFRFGEFVLDLDREALFRGDEAVPLRPKSFEVLRLLVARAGALVTKDELLRSAWPDSVVCDESLSQCLFEIRRALHDRQHRIVRTVPRRGLIFELAVSSLEDARRSAEADRPSQRTLPAVRVTAGVAAALVALALAWLLLHGEPDGRHAEAAVSVAAGLPQLDHVIAVLPLEDLTPEGDHRWFSVGISDEVLNLLAQVPELHVIARTSSFTLRETDLGILEVARRLGADYVLEGSVRKAGEDLRVTVQLVAAASNSQLWSRTYDRSLQDVFGVQNDIAHAVVEALQLEVLQSQPPPVEHVPDPGAWSLHMHAQYLYNRRGTGDLARAAELYRKSVEQDPQLGAAWAGLAATYQIMIMEGEIAAAEGLGLQFAAAQRGLELAPRDATVLMRAARAAGMTGDHDQMWALFHRARELDPDHPLVLGAQAGFLVYRPEQGVDAAESLELFSRCARLDPLGRRSQWNFGEALLRSGRYAEAQAQLRYARELDPAQAEELARHLALAQLLEGDPQGALSTARSLTPGVDRHFITALANFAAGEVERSNEAIATLTRYDDVVSAVRLAEIHSYRDDPEAALEWLETARQRLTPSVAWANGGLPILVATHDPLLLRNEGDRRFMAQIEELRRAMQAVWKSGPLHRGSG